ncbi:MAG: type II toxin-antitoxin system Phd/YefM family antitoxin [Planctomycetota bacterium]
MKHLWQLQEAKNKLSQVVEEALTHGPQIITKRGEEVVIVLSYKDYKQMTVSSQKLSKFFQNSPLTGVGLDLKRDKSGLREDLKL